MGSQLYNERQPTLAETHLQVVWFEQIIIRFRSKSTVRTVLYYSTGRLLWYRTVRLPEEGNKQCDACEAAAPESNHPARFQRIQVPLQYYRTTSSTTFCWLSLGTTSTGYMYGNTVRTGICLVPVCVVIAQ